MKLTQNVYNKNVVADFKIPTIISLFILHQREGVFNSQQPSVIKPNYKLDNWKWESKLFFFKYTQFLTLSFVIFENILNCQIYNTGNTLKYNLYHIFFKKCVRKMVEIILYIVTLKKEEKIYEKIAFNYFSYIEGCISHKHIYKFLIKVKKKKSHPLGKFIKEKVDKRLYDKIRIEEKRKNMIKIVLKK